jgi:iron-sulfur cluster assembly protein
MPRALLPLVLAIAGCSRPSNEAPRSQPAVVAPPRVADAATARIRLTARAAAKIKEVRLAEGVELPLRIEVRLGGPPPGVEYLLYFDEPTQADERFEVDGVTLIVARESVPHVIGTEVDFLETAKGAGFKLNNPNEERLRND